jgi:YesN/AraC family two-component response regulator
MSLNFSKFTLLLIAALLSGIFLAVFIIKKRQKKSLHEPLPSNKKFYVQQARRYLKKNYKDQEISLQKLADELKLDKVYLNTIFKEVTGQNFVDYLNQKRITMAKILLAQTNQSITNIAYDVGYNSLDYFIRLFKTKTGFTPSEYRKRFS